MIYKDSEAQEAKVPVIRFIRCDQTKLDTCKSDEEFDVWIA